MVSVSGTNIFAIEQDGLCTYTMVGIGRSKAEQNYGER